MSFLSVIPVIGKILDKGLGVIDELVEDKDLANKLKTQIKQQILIQNHEEVVKLLESQTSIITSEIQGKSWLQRNWRPLLMVTFNFIIAWNFIVAPIFSLTTVPIPDNMWELLKLCIGGYIIGRSTEKGLKIWKQGGQNE